MRGILHRYRDRLYEKGIGIAIPIFIKLNLTPNQITVLRLIVLIPPAAFLFALNNYFTNIVALVLFHLFTFLDIVDGKIAAVRGMRTRLGEIIDPPIDYIGHNLVFVGIIFGILNSNGVFWIGSYSVFIPTDFLIIFGVLTIVGYSVPIVFSMIPPTRFFMFKDLHDLHKDLFPEDGKQTDCEPFIIHLSKNIVCPYHFPFNVIFKVGMLLTICALLNILSASLIVLSIVLNIRILALFYYFFRVYRKQKSGLSG